MESNYYHFRNFQKIPINGNYNIPTVMYKNKNDEKIGYEALEEIDHHSLIQNFKLDLGKFDQTNFTKQPSFYMAADGKSISSFKAAEIFFKKIFEQVENFIQEKSNAKTSGLMIAEPLALIEDKQWLLTYRKNLKRFFESKFSGNIQFLPEPFAVFQYYKYCDHFPLLNNQSQKLVFVIDFGGGTFDSCLIETTKDGEISQSGKNSKPLGASSINYGGSDIDLSILETILLNTSNDPDSTKRGIRHTRKVLKGKSNYNDLTEEFKNFYNKYLSSLLVVRKGKESLSNQITEWCLDKSSDNSISFSLFKDYFSNDDTKALYQFTELQFKELFIQIFVENLKKGISTTLERGLDESKLRKIDLVLLSGGSSKIGWLFQLLQRDFPGIFSHVKQVSLNNYKEVVSLGLAAECARRFYSEGGDFGDITYNKVNLILEPNEKDIEFPSFKSDIFDTEYDGQIIPSASSIKNHFNQILKWRFRLKSRPTQRLGYYFLLDKLDITRSDFIQNILDTFIHHNIKKFDKHLELELIIREDGTAVPTFILNHFDKNARLEGKPFTIDITYGDNNNNTEAYIGFDFGTTNSSVSFISNNHINVYEDLKANDKSRLFDKILTSAPSLIALPFARFQNDVEDTSKARNFLNLFENVLSAFLYILILEYKLNFPSPAIDLRKYMRASGSIILMLKKLISQVNDDFIFSRQFVKYFDKNLFTLLDEASDFIIKVKHPKIISLGQFEYYNQLIPLLDIVNKFFENNKIGFFTNVKQKDFSDEFEGRFIMTHGSGYFSDFFVYSGNELFNKNYAYLYDKENFKLLNLTPFFHRRLCTLHQDESFGHFYIWDKFQNGGHLFSVASANCELTLDKSESSSNFFNTCFDQIQSENQLTFSKYIDIELNEKQMIL